MVTSVFVFSGSELHSLQRDVRRSQQFAYAEGSFANFNTQWVKFLSFCVKFSLVALPASTPTLSWYAQYLSRKLKSHRSLVSYMAGAKKLHVFLGFTTDGFRGITLILTLQGLRRLNKHQVRRSSPITPAILKLIHSSLDHNNKEDVVFWTACVVAFFLLFRKSNLVPDTQRGFDATKQLRYRDCVDTGQQMVVGIRWAKNEQFNRELLTFPLPKLPGSVLCPVTAIRRMASMIQHNQDDHLFTLGSGISLTYRQFQDKLRHSLEKKGVPNPTSYTSHGYRRGSTTFAFLCGIPSEIIRLLGNWRSDAYLAYIEFPLETRSAASELMKLRILAMEARNTM